MANLYLQEAYRDNDLYEVGQESPILSKLASVGPINVLSVSKKSANDSLDTTIVIHNDLTAPFSTDKAYTAWLTSGFNRLIERGDLPERSQLNVNFESSAKYNPNKAPENKRELHANYKGAFHNQTDDNDNVGLFIYGAWEPDVTEKVDGIYTTKQDACHGEGWNSYIKHRDAGTPVLTICRGSHSVLENEGVRLGKGESEAEPFGNKIKTVATMTRVNDGAGDYFVNKHLSEEIKQQVSRIFRCEESDIHELEEKGLLKILYSSPDEGVGSAIIKLAEHDVTVLLAHPEAGIPDVLGEDARDMLVRGGKTPDGKIDLPLTSNVYPESFDVNDLADLDALEKTSFIKDAQKGLDGNVELAAEFVLRAFVHAAENKRAQGQDLNLDEVEFLAKHSPQEVAQPQALAFG